VALSKLNDPDNALRAFTYSLKLDATDPMTLLNLAILQTNTGASQSNIDGTLEQFYQHYAARETSTNQRELDPSMKEIAMKMGTSSSRSFVSSKSTVDSDDNRHESVPLASLPVASGRKAYEMNDSAEHEPSKAPAELPVVKTKIFDDGRQRPKRNQHRTKTENETNFTENTDQDQSNVF
jgi:hypothetical protein